MPPAQNLARQIADLRRQVAALARSSRLGWSSVDSGAIVVNDASGETVASIGRQPDGRTAIVGPIVATDVELPEGSITETEIADDSVSTPKLRANCVTADKIAAGAIRAQHISADAINGRVITGSTFLTNASAPRVELGQEIDVPGDSAVIRFRYSTDPEPVAEIAASRDPVTFDPFIGVYGPFPCSNDDTRSVIAMGRTLSLRAGSLANDQLTEVRISGPNGVEVNTFVGDAVAVIDPAGTVHASGLFVDGVDQGRGYAGRFSAIANPVLSVTTSDAAVGVVPTRIRPNRAYEVTFRCKVITTTAGDAFIRFRRPGSPWGSSLIDPGRDEFPTRTGMHRFEWSGQFVSGSDADGVYALTLTAVMSSGAVNFVGDSTFPLVIEVRDIGAASDYPDLQVLN